MRGFEARVAMSDAAIVGNIPCAFTLTAGRAAVGPLHNVRDSIEEASVSLGVPPLRSFFNVVLPLIGRLKIEIAEMQLAEGAIPTLIGAARSSTVNPVPLVTRPASGGHSCGCWRDR